MASQVIGRGFATSTTTVTAYTTLTTSGVFYLTRLHACGVLTSGTSGTVSQIYVILAGATILDETYAGQTTSQPLTVELHSEFTDPIAIGPGLTIVVNTNFTANFLSGNVAGYYA